MGQDVLYRFDIRVFRDKASTDKSQVPYAGAQVDFYRQGATVQLDTTIPAGGTTEVPVHDPGDLGFPDRIQAGLGGPTLQVLAVNPELPSGSASPPYPGPTKVRLLNLDTQNQVFLPAGTRLLIAGSTARPRPAFSADPTGTVPLGSSAISDASGRVQGYISVPSSTAPSSAPSSGLCLFDYVIRPVAVLAVSSPATLSGGDNLSWPHPAHALQNCLMIAVAWDAVAGSGSIASINYGGQAMSRVGQSDTSEIWSLLNPPAGPQSVQIQWSPGSTINAVAASMSLSNVDTVGTPQAASGTSSSALLTIPAITPGGLVLSALCVKGLSFPITLTSNPEQVQLWGATIGLSPKIVQGAASRQPTSGIRWNLGSSQTWRLVGIEMRALPFAPTRLFADAKAGAQPSPSWLNVREFPTVQAAVDALPPGGGEIFIPSSVYTLSSSLLISKPNVTLRGQGSSSILQSAAVDPAFHLLQVTADDFKMIDLTLDARATTASAFNALYLFGTSSVPLRRCVLQNVQFLNAGRYGAHLAYARLVYVTNCEFTHNFTDGLRIGDSRVILVFSSHFRENTGRGVIVTGTVFNIGFLGCRFASNKGGIPSAQANAIDVNVAGTSASVAVRSCYFEHPDTATRANQFVRLAGPRGCVVDGCFFQGGVDPAQQPVYAVAFLTGGARCSNNLAQNVQTGLANFTVWGSAFGNLQLSATGQALKAIVNGPPFRMDSTAPGKGTTKFPSYGPTNRPTAAVDLVGGLIWYEDGATKQVQVCRPNPNPPPSYEWVPL